MNNEIKMNKTDEEALKNVIKIVINTALEQGKQVRIENSFATKSTDIIINDPEHKVTVTLKNIILYPGFVNCTRPGTPARITKIRDCGGFGAEGYENVKAYGINMSNDYNSHDMGDESEPEPYYGTDKYLEDGHEASRVPDSIDDYIR